MTGRAENWYFVRENFHMSDFFLYFLYLQHKRKSRKFDYLFKIYELDWHLVSAEIFLFQWN